MTYNMNLEENVYEKPFQHYELNDPETYAAARCHANALYDATLAGEHMKLTREQVIAFWDQVAGFQSQDGMLRFIDVDGRELRSYERVDLWYQPTYAAVALGIHAYLRWPELFDEARTAVFSKLLEASLGRHFAGPGHSSCGGFVEVMRMFVRAGLGQFLKEAPEICPVFTKEIQQTFERVASDILCAREEKSSLTELDFQTCISSALSELLAQYHGFTETVFVYGTLMSGQQANDLLDGSRKAGDFMLRGYQLIDLGAYPTVRETQGVDDAVLGEVWFVTPETLKRLDEYEGYGSLYTRRTVWVDNMEGGVNAQVYYGLGEPEGRVVPLLEQPWNSGEEMVWYAAYGSNLCAERMACYLQGGACPETGISHIGCSDPSLWQDDFARVLRGDVYFANQSGRWNGQGAAFFDPAGRGHVVMRLYKITRAQAREVQEQEGMSPLWYGRTYCLGVETDGLPIITFTSVQRGQQNKPDEAYMNVLCRGIRECQKMNKREAMRYWKSWIPRQRKHKTS